MRTGSRLVSIIAQVKNLDSVSDRGQRKFTIGIETPEGKALLEGFEFNKYAPLSTILKPAYEVDTDTGSFSDCKGFIQRNIWKFLKMLVM